MLAALLVAQIVISAPSPPLSPDEAVRVLRASRSTADFTDLRLDEAPEPRTPSFVLPWHPGDGPFGRFDERLTRLDLLQRGSGYWMQMGYYGRGYRHAPGVRQWRPVRPKRSFYGWTAGR